LYENLRCEYFDGGDGRFLLKIGNHLNECSELEVNKPLGKVYKL
jgi:hypothetical protein